MSSLRSLGFVAAAMLLTPMNTDAQLPQGPMPLRPSTFATTPGEVWTEGGLQTVNNALLIEPTGQRSRVRLLTRGSAEILVEGSTFMVINGGPNGLVIKSVGGATVTSTATKRRMNADSVEVGLSADGWGYFKAVRHPN